MRPGGRRAASGRVAPGLAFLVLATLWSVLLCGPALAHAELEEAAPAEGDTLSEQPEEVRLRFNEPVRAEFDPIQVYDAGGERVDGDDGRTDPEDPDVVVVSLDGLAEGSYTVEWRVTSADGDPIDGSYEFAMGDSALDAEGGGEEEPTADSSGSGGVSFATILGVLLVGVLAVGGLVALRGRRGGQGG